MRNIYFILIISILLGCKGSSDKKEESKSILGSFSILFWNANRITLSGQAVKGIIKNGTVNIFPLNALGVCDKANVLSTTETDDSGNYSLKFNKTGKVVCAIVTGNSSSTMYDEKTKSDLPVPSSFELVNVLSEASIIDGKKKNATVSIFSRMILGRLQNLQQANAGNSDMNTTLRKASKEIVIRMGLNSGISGLSGKSNREVASKAILDSDYPEYSEINFDFSDPSSPLPSKFIATSGGFSHLANKYKKGATTSSDDLDSVINAFASDFEDGLFDGKTAKGESITLGTGTNKITFGSTPLTSILYPAIVAYFAEGGVLSIGAPTRPGSPALPPSTLSTTQLGTIQFIDNTPITAVAPPGETPTVPPTTPPPSALTYTGSPFSFLQSTAISTVTPTVTGTVSSCSSAPALPTGLTINNTTCAISGTATGTQTATNHTITASNASGNTTAVISITVNSDCPGATAARNWGTFTDCNNGTIKLVVTAGTFGGNIYTGQTLFWMKCGHGQTYNLGGNNCLGGAGTTVQYCNANDNSCNGGTNTGILNGGGTSGAYSACGGLNGGAGTFNKTNWRVPTKNEAKLLINCNVVTEMPNDQTLCSSATNPTINTSLFPNTQNYYWHATSFDATSAYVTSNPDGNSPPNGKTNVFYVRCISGP